MFGPQEGINLDGVINNISDNREVVGPLEGVGFNNQVKDTGNGAIHRKKKPKSVLKRRKTIRKGVSQLVHGDKVLNEGVSDFSISDEDIEQRNKSILKEAEATWEVSSVLGLTFDKNKQQMVEVFSALEECDRRGRGV